MLRELLSNTRSCKLDLQWCTKILLQVSDLQNPQLDRPRVMFHAGQLEYGAVQPTVVGHRSENLRGTTYAIQ